MLHNLILVASQVGTLFLLMGVGFVLGKKSRVTPEGLAQMAYLLLYVVSVCVVVRSLQTPYTPTLLKELALGTIGVTGVYLCSTFLCRILFRRRSPDTGDPLRFGAIYGNTGFMGLPLVLGILGQEAVIYAMISFVVFTLFSWTHGVFIMGGRAACSLKRAVLNPGIIAVAIGLPLFLLNLPLPGALNSAVGYLADLNTPLAMVVIGAQMSATDLSAAFRRSGLYAASLVKLVLIPLAAAILLLPLRGYPKLYCASVLLSAAPTAGVTSMFAQRFGRDTATAAQLVTCSTVLSLFTLPCMAVLAQRLSS